MRAAVATSQDPDDPLSGLQLLEVPAPEPREGWVRVRVRAAALNLHDVWTLRGIGHPADRIPIVLGCDAAGVTDDGREVIVHPVLGDPEKGGGDVTLDPDRALLSETIDGAFAEYVLVPARNIVPKPAWLSFEEAAALPVAWGTAYRMLFTRARIRPGDRVLVQGSSGGVASAAISLAAAAGARVYATGRSERKRDYAIERGAHAAFENGARLPERVDVVVETVGEATWAHSLRSLRPGGTIVIAGATSGSAPSAELMRMFYLQQQVIGSTGCTRSELESLLRMMEVTGVRPHLDRTIELADIAEGFAALIEGEALGKIAVRID